MFSHTDPDSPYYLDLEIYDANSANGNSVQPLDGNSSTWTNPLLPSLNLGPLAEGEMSANIFVFALGFSVILLIIYMFKRMRILSDTWALGRKSMNGGMQVYNEVSSQINKYLEYSDISNCIG